jgi:hypothetical protein
MSISVLLAQGSSADAGCAEERAVMVFDTSAYLKTAWDTSLVPVGNGALQKEPFEKWLPKCEGAVGELDSEFDQKAPW